MGVYIDMEMPQEGFVEILVRSDGTVQQTGQSYRIDETDYYTPYVGEMPVMYEAVHVPPHGRLIDADALDAGLKEMSEIEWNQKAAPVSWAYAFDTFRDIIERDEPTIIPAEEGET